MYCISKHNLKANILRQKYGILKLTIQLRTNCAIFITINIIVIAKQKYSVNLKIFLFRNTVNRVY